MFHFSYVICWVLWFAPTPKDPGEYCLLGPGGTITNRMRQKMCPWGLSRLVLFSQEHLVLGTKYTVNTFSMYMCWEQYHKSKSFSYFLGDCYFIKPKVQNIQVLGRADF